MPTTDLSNGQTILLLDIFFEIQIWKSFKNPNLFYDNNLQIRNEESTTETRIGSSTPFRTNFAFLGIIEIYVYNFSCLGIILLFIILKIMCFRILHYIFIVIKVANPNLYSFIWITLYIVNFFLLKQFLPFSSYLKFRYANMLIVLKKHIN